MGVLYALILGIVQGLTEFLPISSSGHLLLIEHIFGITEGNLFFNILLHIASLLAVVIIMRKEIVNLLKRPFSKKVGTLLLSCVITVVVVLFLSCVDKFTTISYLGFGFLISAILLLVTHIMANKQKKLSLKSEIGYLDAAIIGVIQGIATLPGISRSGSTICTSLLLGNSRKSSANFSFLISIPIIIGAMVFELIKGDFNATINISAISCIIGFVASFVVALLSIKLMLKVIEKGKWLWFSIYLFILSMIVLLNQYIFMWF